MAVRKFSVNYSSLKFWDVNSTFLKITNRCKWETKPLSNLVDIRSEEASSIEISSGTIKLLDRISFDEGKIHAGKKNDTKMKQFKGYFGDIVVSKINARKGAVGIVQDDSPIGSTIHFRTLIPKSDIIDTKFLWIALRSSFCRNQFAISTGGQGKGEISEERLMKIEAPSPPLQVQKKIVEYWDKSQQGIKNGQRAQNDLVYELNDFMIQQTRKYNLLRQSKLFRASFSQTPQWDVKAGRAAVLKEANPSFVRLGDYTEECAEMIKPWEYQKKLWPIYGVNNKDGVFLSTEQETSKFNAAYKRIEKDWFFHNPTRANVGSLGIVPEVPDDAITSPEYQVWKLTSGFKPEFMDLLLQTQYFLTLVSFNRVGGVKQRMYYANLAEIRLPLICPDTQKKFITRKAAIKENLKKATYHLAEVKKQVEKLILGTLSVEDL